MTAPEISSTVALSGQTAATTLKPQGATELSARLVAAREALDLTTSQLARRLGVRTQTLRNWENGSSEPRPNRLVMLAGMLGVPVSWLITGDEALHPTSSGSPKLNLLGQKLERAQRLQADLSRLLGEIAIDFAAFKDQQH